MKEHVSHLGEGFTKANENDSASWHISRSVPVRLTETLGNGIQKSIYRKGNRKLHLIAS